MGDKTPIEWADSTWNPITGCALKSPGCRHCYAMKLAGGRMVNHPSRAGLTISTPNGPVWNGDVRFNEDWLDDPLRWRKPRIIFVCAHADLFYERVPDEWIRRIFEVMWQAHQHIFIVLTKRPKRMARFLRNRATLANVWVGTSVEDQKHADLRLPHLAGIHAALRLVSVEPMLGPVDLSPWLAVEKIQLRGREHWTERTGEVPSIGWVIAGGESGPGARPMHAAWPSLLRKQCAAAEVPFLFKQWGNWTAYDGTQPATPIERQCWLAEDGRHFGGSEREAARVEKIERDAGEPIFKLMVNIGKGRTGKLLDGREYLEFPKRAPF